SPGPPWPAHGAGMDARRSARSASGLGKQAGEGRARPCPRLDRLWVGLGSARDQLRISFGSARPARQPPPAERLVAAAGIEQQLEPADAKRVAAEVHARQPRSEEHTSELQSRENLVCRLLLEKKKNREL